MDRDLASVLDIIHRYDDVNLDKVWEIVTTGVPGLVANLESLLPPESQP